MGGCTCEAVNTHTGLLDGLTQQVTHGAHQSGSGGTVYTSTEGQEVSSHTTASQVVPQPASRAQTMGGGNVCLVVQLIDAFNSSQNYLTNGVLRYKFGD